jgi:hypothetical protein
VRWHIELHFVVEVGDYIQVKTRECPKSVFLNHLLLTLKWRNKPIDSGLTALVRNFMSLRFSWRVRVEVNTSSRLLGTFSNVTSWF